MLAISDCVAKATMHFMRSRSTPERLGGDRAHRRHPADRDCHVVIFTIGLERGDTACTALAFDPAADTFTRIGCRSRTSSLSRDRRDLDRAGKLIYEIDDEGD